MLHEATEDQRNMESPDSPKPPLKGVVVITLPPPEDLSIGKTITFYALSPQQQQSTLLPRNPPNPQNPLPVQLPSTHQFQFSLRRSLELGTRKRVWGLLGAFLFAFILWYSFSPQNLGESRKLLNDYGDDDHGPKTFVLPLYPKSGLGKGKLVGDLELKLGRFVEGGGIGDGHYKVSKVGSAASKLDFTSVLPLRGNIYPDGLYFTYLHVGNPPRPYSLDLDTGSDLTWIQCDAPCMSCAKGPHRLYKPVRSKIVSPKDMLCSEVQRNPMTTYHETETCQQCHYKIEYADHSSSMGVLVKDELNLKIWNGSLVKLDVVLGCAYDQRGSLLNSLVKTDGILGLSKAQVSLPSQLANQGIINNVFGHCLMEDASGGGYMFLGDELVPERSIAWVPMVTGLIKNSYTAEIVSASYGSRQMKLDGPDGVSSFVLFDSGSSYTYFPGELYSKLLASLEVVSVGGLSQDASDPMLPLCWRSEISISSVADVKHLFKPLILKFRSRWWFSSSHLRIPPEGYLVLSKTGNICLGILDGSEVLGGSFILLGDISMRGQLIVYDNVKGRIGWAKSVCMNPRGFNRITSLMGIDLSI